MSYTLNGEETLTDFTEVEMQVKFEHGLLGLTDLIELPLILADIVTNCDEASDDTFDQWIRQFIIPQPREVWSLEDRRDLLNLVGVGNGPKPNFDIDVEGEIIRGLI